MQKIYRTDDRIIREVPQAEAGCWIMLTTPTMDECTEISEKYGIDISDLRAALDDEESSRITLEDDYTLILVDIPTAEIRP